MILRTRFALIDSDIKTFINQTLDSLRVNKESDYVLFLAEGEYNKDYDTPNIKFSPYVIDSRMDKYMDESRLKFLSDFLNGFYSFPKSQKATDDNDQRLHMELMVYTHIWESKPFLKKLYRFARLVNNESYHWKVAVPDMSKHDFIRTEIRQVFEDNGNPIAAIIRNGFHTSLRNAFAHSEYSFDTMNNNRRIILSNYNGAGWELPYIGFDDWSERFVYSALLSFHLLDIVHKKRTALVQDLGTDEYHIWHPRKTATQRLVKIKYRPQHDGFNFV